MAQIVSIAWSPQRSEPRPKDHYHRDSFSSAVLTVDRGIEGDRKGKGRDRQLNIMSAETLASLAAEGFKTGPGQMGEQIVLEGIEIDSLPVGARIRLGESAVVEVTIARTGCDRFEHIQGKLTRLVRGRLGVMARVVTGGPIALGDPVTIE
jgi:MOSC domain-containing protein YiiM